MAIVKATEPFSYVRPDGVLDVVTTERLFDGDDPVVKQRPHLFEPVEVAAARTSGATETASAAPGEARARKSPIKKPGD